MSHFCYHKNIYGSTKGEQMDIPTLCHATSETQEKSVAQEKGNHNLCHFVTNVSLICGVLPGALRVEGPNPVHLKNSCVGSGPSSPWSTSPAFPIYGDPPWHLQGYVSIKGKAHMGLGMEVQDLENPLCPMPPC